MTTITKAAQALDTDTLRELVTRLALEIDTEAKLEAFPEALAFQVDMARAVIRAALQDKAREDATIEDNSQQWAGMDGATAWLLINRHADGWADVDKMMSEWLKANTHPAPVVPDDVARDAGWFRLIRDGGGWPAVFASHDAPEPLRGDDLDASMIAASQQKGGQHG